MEKEKFAVISDLHSNLEAVTAVLKDIEMQGVEDIYCLGDVIGYGPNPNEILGMTDKFKFTILGNHDGAVLNGKGLKSFNPLAAQAVLWTRKEISYPNVSRELSSKNNIRLKNMTKLVKKGYFLFAHGSVKSNAEYIMSYADALQSFHYMEQNKVCLCFVGHTHRPGIFYKGNKNKVPYNAQKYYNINEKIQIIVNVGSVGQARDHSKKPCYVIVEGDRFCYRRVDYDVEKTVSKIYNNKHLNNFLGDRLKINN